MSLFKRVLFSSALCVLAIGLSVSVRAVVNPSIRAVESERVEVKIYRLAKDPRGNQPVVLLSDPLEQRAMPIWIGMFEADALNSEMSGVPNLRPQTHDLLETVMRKAGLKILRIAITHIEGNIYYASISMEGGGSVMDVDARPSDALVMALKFNAPIFVSGSLFTDKSFALDREEAEDEDLWHQAPGQPI